MKLSAIIVISLKEYVTKILGAPKEESFQKVSFAFLTKETLKFLICLLFYLIPFLDTYKIHFQEHLRKK